MLIVALLAPVLGAFGDFRGYRKKLFFGFMLLGALSCAALAATPLMDLSTQAQMEKVGMVILVLYIVSTIGFAGANLYYDSFLNDVTTEERMDKVSTMGYGLGYIGGSTIPLLIFLLMVGLFGVDMMVSMSFAFGLTAVWWFVFSLPLLKNVQQKSWVEKDPHPVRHSLRKLAGTAREIYRNKAMFVYLVAYFFYIDGVNTCLLYTSRCV